ncbi:MAG: HD domain-containing protein [Planctomycetes bacterium]|nr:HD domain-containing protein [Planctomycetota bacterium]
MAEPAESEELEHAFRAEARERVLVLDADPAIRSSIAYFLNHRGTPAVAAASAEAALEQLAEGSFFLLITETLPPGLSGLELLSRVRARHPEVDVIFTAGSLEIAFALRAVREGALDFLRKPFELDELAHSIRRARERRGLLLRVVAAEKLAERTRLTEEHVRDAIVALAAMIDAKSRFTRSHSERVASYSARLASAMGLAPEVVQRVRFGGRIHDIGKIGTPDAILEKPGPLTPEEWVEMRRHPAIGAECLRGMGILQPYLPMVELHHENWDGSGYPLGLRGEETPLEARIVKVADYYDAITSRRPYREPLALGKAIDYLRAERGRLLDPDLTELFIEIGPERVLRDRARRRRPEFEIARERGGA